MITPRAPDSRSGRTTRMDLTAAVAADSGYLLACLLWVSLFTVVFSQTCPALLVLVLALGVRGACVRGKFRSAVRRWRRC